MTRTFLTLALALTAAFPAAAQTIIGAQSAVIDSGGPGDGNIADTHNGNGLATPFVSGVTDFDAYLAGDPQHTVLFFGFEWFSNFGTTSAVVTYDLGSIASVDRLALWNDEFSGIGLLNLLASTDGISFTSLGNFVPTDNPPGGDSYSADVFAFAATSARYLRFDMSNCPQPNGNNYTSCSIGEVAFRTAPAGGVVPEPGTWAMLIVGVGGVGNALRRRPRTQLRHA